MNTNYALLYIMAEKIKELETILARVLKATKEADPNFTNEQLKFILRALFGGECSLRGETEGRLVMVRSHLQDISIARNMIKEVLKIKLRENQ